MTSGGRRRARRRTHEVENYSRLTGNENEDDTLDDYHGHGHHGSGLDGNGAGVCEFLGYAVIVTEAQARELWCPFSRVVFPGPVVANRVSWTLTKSAMRAEQVAATKCLGSGCMVWRWRRYVEANEGVRGFCGLAPGVPFADEPAE